MWKVRYLMMSMVGVSLTLLPAWVSSRDKRAYVLAPSSYISGESQNELIELYSSEGCSRCPPADVWMSRLRNHPQLWKSIVPITFHVDNWNHLGWLDPFANRLWTQRQKDYASLWKSKRMHTPDFVKNGKKWKEKVFAKKAKKVGVLKVTRTGDYKFNVEYRPHKSIQSFLDKNLKVFGTVLGNGLESQVLKGENRGRTLQHEFVVLQLGQQKLQLSQGVYRGDIEIPLELTASPKSLSVAFWVENKGLPIQSTGGELVRSLELATFAGGCFWCMESPFEKETGVLEVISGYTGGKAVQPTYEQVSSGTTGHTEAVRVIYDPRQISYRELLEIFWRSMDPTDIGGQFVDRGSQYRPGIYYHSREQRDLALQSKEILIRDKIYKQPIALEIKPAGIYYVAGAYHQDYYKRNPFRYKFYRYGSGRDRDLSKIWSKRKNYKIFKRAKEIKMTYARPPREELKKTLNKIQFYVTQQDGTEPPFKNEFWNNKEEGIYVDVVSGEPLFSSKDKFNSGTGWPSFTRPIVADNIVEKVDRKLFVKRTEVRSKHGNSHLGHVFDDGPQPTGLRYCINSASLRFILVRELASQGYGEFIKGFKK